MKFALSFPNFGVFAEPEVLVDLAVRAEDSGWDGFFLWDHIVIADGMPVADPWVSLGAIAQATDRITLGPMVIALPRHRPWVVARQAVSVDRLSRGRLVLGVGLGFPPREEFWTFGDPVDLRVRANMLEEGLEIIRGVWSGRPFSFEGEHYRVETNRFAPPPYRETSIPIWVAGMLPNRRPLRRAARFQGVFPVHGDLAPVTRDEVKEVKSIVERNREDGRSFDYVITGPPRTAGEYSALEDAGVTWYVGGPHPEGEPLEETKDWVSSGPGAYTAG
ncbi:MAG: LLM class flavin-dependent oxidoreductase [Dehalococcoidia bacterium]